MIDNSNTLTPLIYGDFNANTLTFNGTTTTTGDVTVGGGGTASKVIFREPSGSGTNFTSFEAQAQTADVVYTLPANAGTNGYVLTTNGTGTLSWAAASGGATSIDGLSDAISTLGGTSFTNSMILGHQNVAPTNAFRNTGVGLGGVLQTLTSGDDNTAFGYQALATVSDGWGLTAVGSGALQAATAATRTVAVGYQAGYNVTDGSYSVFVGYESGKSYTSTGASVGIGYRALYNATGAHNIGVGLETMVNTTGTNNIAIGSYTGGNVSSGSNNVAVGYGAAQKITSGSSNVIIGNSAGPTNAVGNVSNKLYIHNSESDSPLIYGDFSGGTLTFNGAITTTGTSALNGNVTVGGGATASQLRLLEPSGSGSNFTAFKAQAQAADVTYTLPAADGTNGYVLTTNGSGTLSWAAASGGASAINDLSDAVRDITNFTNSMILGHETTGTLSSALRNTAVGLAAMDAITSGDDNAVFGYNAATALDAGSQNVIIGSGAGSGLTSGTGNVLIGYNAGSALSTETNRLYIDNSSTTLPLIQGDFTADTLRFNGSTTTSGKTTYEPPGTSKTQTATTSSGASAPDISTFTNTYEKVSITAASGGAGFVQLPTGTDGQVVYLRMVFTAASANTVTVVNSNNNNTAMVYDGAGADVIVAHMLYTTGEGWVIFSAIYYDN